jgi:hypothetical protein
VFIWGDSSHRDAYDTWFDRSRPPEMSFNGNLAGREICYEHGMDGVIGKSPIGTITRTWFDATGLAFTGTLDRSSNYFQRFIDELRAGELKTSSATAAHVADFYPDGAFKSWLLAELSLTKNPAEFEMPAVSLVRSQTDTSVSAHLEKVPPMLPDNTRNATDLINEMVAAGYSLDEIASAVQSLMTPTPGDPTAAMSAPEDVRSLANQLRTALEGRISGQREANRLTQVEGELAAMRTLLEQRQAEPPPPSDTRFMRRAPQPQISVSEDLRYAHLSAEQMALGVKLIMAGVSPMMRGTYRMGDLVDNGILTEGYLRSMANKSVAAMAAMQPRTDPISLLDRQAMRSVMPFRADELHATDITSHGAEWVETFYDTTLWERARDQTELFNLMQERGMEVVTIPQGANGMNVKLNTASGAVYTLSEPNNVDSSGRPEVAAKFSQFSTSEVEEPASTHVLAHGVTFQLEEDSIINIISWLPMEMETTLAEALENAMLNGDKTATASTNINIIDGTPASGLEKPAYMAFNGIYKNALVTNTSYSADGGALAIEDYQTVLGRFPSAIKARKKNMLFIIDSSTENATRVLPELLTFGVAGAQNTIYSGDLPPLFGVMPYMSGQAALANTSGKISVTPGNNTKGRIAAAYAPYWKYGRKRAVTIEQERSAIAQSTVFVITVRHAFVARGAGAASVNYNQTV